MDLWSWQKLGNQSKRKRVKRAPEKGHKTAPKEDEKGSPCREVARKFHNKIVNCSNKKCYSFSVFDQLSHDTEK